MVIISIWGGTAFNAYDLTKSEEWDNTGADFELAGIPIYYNPNSVNQDTFDPDDGYAIDCATQGDFNFKFNVIKIDLDGDVIWNNYYGLPNTRDDAWDEYGLCKSLVMEGNYLVAAGRSDVGGISKQIVTKIDKNTGYIQWKLNFGGNENGQINQIFKQGVFYLLSGYTVDSNNHLDAFVSLVLDPSLSSPSNFASQLFYKELEGDFGPSISVTNPTASVPLNTNPHHNSQSAIFTNTGEIFWFAMANNSNAFFSGANICENSLVINLDYTGAIIEAQDFGEIRAYDMWMSGTPTSDGGFALVTSRHSPRYFETGNIPSISEDLGYVNFTTTGTTIEDCLDCDPGSGAFEYWSTCAYVRKYSANFEFQWDKIWNSKGDVPRDCLDPTGFDEQDIKQQECLYRIIQSSVDDGLLIVGNTSKNFDDSYIVKLYNDCGLTDFFGAATGGDLVVEYDEADDYTVEINGTETWNSPKKVLGRVLVKDGAVLNIVNTTVEFVSNSNLASRIEVEPNGELIVDNSTLQEADDCGDNWDGLYAHSRSTESQDKVSNYRHQGYIQLDDSYVIQARAATNNFQYGTDDLGGGIIIAKNTTFENCRRDGQFLKYQNFDAATPSLLKKDMSRFTLCNFIKDDDFSDQASNSPRVTQWATDGVDFYGCTFRNTKTEQNSSGRSNGIFTSSAIFKVDAYCSSGTWNVDGTCSGTETPSTFEGFYRGIEATAGGPGTPFYVERSEFDENFIGVLSTTISDPVIENNTFTISNHGLDEPQDLGHLKNVGIALSSVSTGYKVERNDLIGTGDATSYGITAANSGEASNVIRSNYLERLDFGNYAYGVNVNPNITTIGLEYFCNENVTNERDFHVTAEVPFNTEGVRKYQGSDQIGNELKAGNKFSANSNPNSDQHIFVSEEVIPMQYCYENVTSEIPLDYNNEVTPILVSNPDENCARDPGGQGGLGKDNETEPSIVDYINLKNEYYALLNGGNTEALIDEIDYLSSIAQEGEPNGLGSIQNSFLTSEVIIEIILGFDLLFEDAFELVLANPSEFGDHALNQVLLDYYGSSMIDEITASISSEILANDPKLQMELTIGNLANDLKEQNTANIHALRQDSAGYTINALLEMQLKELSLAEYYSHVFTKFNAGMVSESLADLEEIDSYFHLTESQANELEGIQAYIYFLQTLQIQETEVNNLDQSQIEELGSLASNPEYGRGAYWANNVLCFHYSICNQGVPESSGISTGPAYTANGINNSESRPSVDLYLSPNPAQSEVVIYQTGDKEPITSIQVYDMQGRLIIQENTNSDTGLNRFSIEQLSNGIYLCVFEMPHIGQKTAKLIVEH